VFEGAFSPLHWLIVLAIAVLIFGPSKLPEIGKNLDTAIRGFREALSETSKPGAAPSAPHFAGWKSLCPVCQSMKAYWVAKFRKVTTFSSVKWPLS
jgi:sec-independent protein translocase protein TatA